MKPPYDNPDQAMQDAVAAVQAYRPSPQSNPQPVHEAKPVPAKKGKKGTLTNQPDQPPSCTAPNPPEDYNIYNIEKEDIENIEKEVMIDNKGQLTNQERTFILLHLIHHIPARIALVSAGYKKYTDKHAYLVAAKIRKKYELGTEGAEIFSDLNFGPMEIARGIVDIARNCPNQQVKLNALALCAKATGLLRDAIEAQPGVTIIIKGRDTEAQAAQPGGREPAKITQQHGAVPTGPVAITR